MMQVESRQSSVSQPTNNKDGSARFAASDVPQSPDCPTPVTPQRRQRFCGDSGDALMKKELRRRLKQREASVLLSRHDR
jgi:hypothetical protein